jgi:hypothetical protein
LAICGKFFVFILFLYHPYNFTFSGNANFEVIYMPAKKKRIIVDGNADRPIPKDIYPVIDNDLARDNLENDNDLSDVDSQDL